jgi:transposase-like protein
MRSVLVQPIFRDDAAAYAKLESIIWPAGPVCVHCGEANRLGLLKGKATRLGLYKCYACRRQFRVTVGTVFESSHVPLHMWLQAAYMMVSSKKGISTHQMHRATGCTLKSAWFITMRIREAMKEVGWPAGGKLGGGRRVASQFQSLDGRKSYTPFPQNKVVSGLGACRT